MVIVTVQSAKTHLSRLLKRVEAGEEIVIARGRITVARLVSVASSEPSGRVFGAARGRYAFPPADAFAILEGTDLEAWE